MIINGELQTGLGGGVCQVSTTVFNAAYEAGLSITGGRTTRSTSATTRRAATRRSTTRTSTSKFVNDTGHWLLLRTFVGSSLATCRPLRDAAAPSRRERDGAARGRPARVPVEARRRPDAAQGAEGRSRRAARRRARRASRRRVYARGRRAALRQHVVLVLPRRADGRPRRDEAEAEAAKPTTDGRRPDRRAPERTSGCQRADRRRRARRRLGSSDRLGEPGRDARRAVRASRRRRRGASSRPRRLAVALDRVVEAEAGAAELAAARAHVSAVVEGGRPQVADVRLDRQRLDPVVAQRRVAARKRPR